MAARILVTLLFAAALVVVLRYVFLKVRGAWRKRPGVWRVVQYTGKVPGTTGTYAVAFKACKGLAEMPLNGTSVETGDEDFESKLADARVKAQGKVDAMNAALKKHI